MKLYYNYNKDTKIFRKGSSLIDSVIDHTGSIWKYNLLAIKFPKQLDHLREGLIVAQSIDDNECFKCYLIIYLNPVDRNPRRFTKADKDFAKRLDFKDIKFPVKIIDIHRMKRKNSINISIFGYENKGKC